MSTLNHRIGLVYVRGALPCFEEFGNLPTDLVPENGLIDGQDAADVLDMMIIPGGSLVESQSISEPLENQIRRMAEAGKIVLGICSGFQMLSNGTDIGRLSPTPIWKAGLGLLDVTFKPLICTDQVKATITATNRLTDAVGAEVSGFHCHTYGEITLQKNAKPILTSHVERLNYSRQKQDIVSGVSNQQGNVIGLLPHAILDRNEVIIEGLTKSLNIDADELKNIRRINAKLQSTMKSEVGISSGIHAEKRINELQRNARFLLITALESGGGKTFVSTGLAGALRKKGWKVGVIKVGGDVRDIVPALYLTKEPMQEYSSIVVAETGWKDAFEAVRAAEKTYDLVIIEGAMNAFTGLLFNQLECPTSTAEIATALGVPTVIVSGCDKEGIEGGIVNALSYVHFFKKLGIKTAGVILNKVYLDYTNEETRTVVKEAFAQAGAELLGILPITDAEGRGAIPEVEIKYEKFCASAMETAEQYLNVDRVVDVAAPLTLDSFDYSLFVEKFKKSLVASFGLDH
jgi:cobyric acid synthase